MEQVVSASPRPLYSLEEPRYPMEEAVCATGPVSTIFNSAFYPVLSFLVFEGNSYARCKQFSYHTFVLLYVGCINVLKFNKHSLTRGTGSSVGIATGYGLNGPERESRWGARFSAPVQTGPGVHPASCTMGTGSFPGVKSGRSVTLTPHPLIVPWS
jgi:hypothetical protein